MYTRVFITIFLTLIVETLTLIDTTNHVYVTTSRGQVVGYHFDQGNDTSQIYYGQGDIFLGIPYVQPPVGALRYSVRF